MVTHAFFLAILRLSLVSAFFYPFRAEGFEHPFPEATEAAIRTGGHICLLAESTGAKATAPADAPASSVVSAPPPSQASSKEAASSAVQASDALKKATAPDGASAQGAAIAPKNAPEASSATVTSSANPAESQDQDSVRVNDQKYHTKVQVSMVSDYKSVNPGQAFWVGLILQMPEGWHIYWQNPGDDSGLATTVTWSVPEGFQIDPSDWPTPQRIKDSDSISYGYVGGETPILAKITPSKLLPIGHSFPIKASVNWIECQQYCSPGEAHVQTKIHLTDDDPEWNIAGRYIIQKAQGERPVPLPQGWEAMAYRYPNKLIKLKITPAKGALNPKVDQAYFYPFDDAVPTNSPQTSRKVGENLVLELAENESKTPTKLKGLVYAPKCWMVGNSLTSMVIEAPIVSADTTNSDILEDPVSKKAGTFIGLMSFIGLGFLGGLILNLMPCVFPVLGIKLINLVRQAQEDRTKIIRHSLFFTLGILASFWGMALIINLVRSAGQEVGWGFQLQYPVLVFLITVLMLVLGLSLSGLFEIGTSFARLADKIGGQTGYWGSFMSGVLDTVVASPCSAPFLAPALGAALLIPLVPSLAVFTAIGLGLSTPYLCFCFFPGFLRVIPAPGPWMETFKQVMAFLFYLTAGYFLWVLIGQIDSHMLMNVLIGLVSIAFSAWLYGKITRAEGLGSRSRLAGILFSLSALSIGLAVGLPLKYTQKIQWDTWSADRVKALQAEGRPILVEFSARWCLICQANKRAYESPEVIKMIKQKNIATLMADWTNRDPKITAALNEFGAPAVPLALLYGPNKKEPTLLPKVVIPSILVGIMEGLPDVNSDTH